MSKYLCFLIVLILNIKFIKCDVFEECDGVPDESFVASKTDCTIYIYCMGEDSQYGECDEGQYFDPEALACDAKENVFCALDQPAQEPGNAEVAEETETAGNDGVAEEEVEIEPDNELITESITMPTTLTTTVATTTTTTTEITTTTTVASIIEVSPETSGDMNIIANAPLVKETCPTQDNPNQIVLIGNNMSCSDYYVCYHGHAIQMHCTSYLHFNIATGQCDYPENVKCFETGDASLKCLPHVTDFFPHPDNCNYFYYCIRGFLTVQQCPFFYGWDVERRACVQISQAKCYTKKIR